VGRAEVVERVYPNRRAFKRDAAEMTREGWTVRAVHRGRPPSSKGDMLDATGASGGDPLGCVIAFGLYPIIRLGQLIGGELKRTFEVTYEREVPDGTPGK
jgi:hypothetical protein